MNRELADVIRIYATGSHKQLSSYLIDKSKDNLIAILVDLLTMYINDKNSSTIREFITVTLAGYTHQEGKIGYNGYRQCTFEPGKTIKCEAKPKNINTEEFEKYRRGERKSPPAKLNGGGNFSDYTLERFKRDMKEDLNLLVSGFVDGKLLYIIEFPFRTPDFVNNLLNKLKLWQNKLQGSKSTKGQFLRSAGFDYNDYITSQHLRIVYLVRKAELQNYEPYIVKGFYEFLARYAE